MAEGKYSRSKAEELRMSTILWEARDENRKDKGKSKRILRQNRKMRDSVYSLAYIREYRKTIEERGRTETTNQAIKVKT